MAGCLSLLPSIIIGDVNEPPVSDITSIDSGFDVRSREPEQQSLFAGEDLVVPETLRSMRKAISAIHAVPTKAEHSQSLNSKRLFDALILVAQVECRKEGAGGIERIRNERRSPLFTVRIGELARLANIPGKNYERLYAELDNLYDMTLAWNVIGEDNAVEWELKSHFLSSLAIGRGVNRGLVRFAFDPAVLEIVLEPSRWATLSLQAMADLKTAPAYSLYQAVWRYVGTQHKVTAALPAAMWIELMVGKSRYVVEDPKLGKRVRNYGDFKRRVLLDAMERVNNVQALGYTIELKEIKSGTRVTRLQFKFVEKQQPSLGIPLTWPRDVLDALASVGLQPRDVEDLSEAHSYEEVAEALVRLKTAEGRLRAGGQGITSRAAYFRGILRNIAEGAVGDDLDDAKIEAEVRQQEAQRAAEARRERLKEAFAHHQKERFSAWVFALPSAERDALVQAFQASGDATPPLRAFFDKGLSPSNMSAVAVLRGWLTAARPDLMELALSNPEDASFEAWMAWKADGG